MVVLQGKKLIASSLLATAMKNNKTTQTRTSDMLMRCSDTTEKFGGFRRSASKAASDVVRDDPFRGACTHGNLEIQNSASPCEQLSGRIRSNGTNVGACVRVHE